MTSSRGPLVYNHLQHHHHHQAPTIGFQMTSFSSLYVEGGLQELVCGESGAVRTAAAMYRRAGGHLHYAATTAGIKKEPRDLGYDVTGTIPQNQLMAITLSKPNRFSKFFHHWKEEQIVNTTIQYSPLHPKYVATLSVENQCSNLRQITNVISDETKHIVSHGSEATVLSSVQSLLKMSFCPHTHSKTLTPLVNCIVNDALVHDVSNVQQTLL